MNRRITESALQLLQLQMLQEEKSANTCKKYMRDVRKFVDFIGEDTQFDKSDVIRYKQFLQEKYQISSINSMLSSLNYAMSVWNWHECKVKLYKVQRTSFRENQLTKGEYERLLQTAMEMKKPQLFYIMMTMATTGARISELQFLNVESLDIGYFTVLNKGKCRRIVLTKNLIQELRKYLKYINRKQGPIFTSKNGNPLDRSNINRQLKLVGKKTGVAPSKLFPHNFRHFFAVEYYRMEHDICHLADILGHTNINTTRIYTQLEMEEHVRTIEKMNLFVAYKGFHTDLYQKDNKTNKNRPQNINYVVCSSNTNKV